MPGSHNRPYHNSSLRRLDISNPAGFSHDSRLQGLATRVEALRMLAAVIREHVDPALRDHVRPGGYQDGTLTLLFDSAAWMTRFRYQRTRTEALMRSAAGLEQLREIRCRVAPPSRYALPKPRPPQRITRKGAQIISNNAEEFTDPELRAAFRRLAETIGANAKT